MKYSKSNLLPPVSSAILAIFYAFPFLLRLNNWGVRDWDVFLAVLGAPVGSLVHYGQFPFWNPYMAGGNILFHHPEVGILSPFFLLHLIFGIVVGLKLQVLVCYFVGFWGTQKLADKLGISPIAALMTAVAYFGSVHFALHFAEGHIPFTHFCFLPWFLYFVLVTRQNRRSVVLAAVALALMILGNGAAVPLLYTITFSVGFFTLLAFTERKPDRLISLAQAIGLGLALSAVKFLPMVVYLLQNEWPGNPDESIPLQALGSMFFGIKHSLFVKNFPGQVWGWHEYGMYLSPLLVMMAAVALVRRFKRYWIYLALVSFFLALGLGNFGSVSPWAILSHLPGFGSTRCTGRALQMVLLCVALLTGFGFDQIGEYLREKTKTKLRPFLYTAFGLIVLSNMILAWPIMASAFKYVAPDVYRSAAFSHVIDQKPQAFKNYLANRGSLITPWLSAYKPSRALVGPGDVVLMENIISGTAEVKQRHYTPNRIEYEIVATEPGEITICMGFDNGWYAEDGRTLSERDYLISFPFDKGRQTVVLRYRPPYFFAGLAVSILAILWLAWLLGRHRHRSDSG